MSYFARTSLVVLVVTGAPFVARSAGAAEPAIRLHGAASVAHALGDPQQRELGFGGVVQGDLEFPIARALGLEASVAGLGLFDGSPPSDPRLVDRSGGIAGFFFGGVRAQLPARTLWADVGLGLGVTGGPRFAGGARVGWDFQLDGRDRFRGGPMLGYLHVLQPDDSLRPEDAHILHLGVHVVFGEPPPPPAPVEPPPPPPPPAAPPPPPPAPPPRADRDNDTVFDDEDACPDVPGQRTDDPKTNGCPPAAEGVRMEGDRIVLDELIHFDLNSPRVRHVSWPLVQKVAAFINANPDILEIDIEGHADRLGTEEHNMKLSKDRADAVQRLLVKFGVDASRVTARGFGESRPISHTRREANPIDRRVEFWVVRVRPAQQPASGGTP